MWRSAVGNTTKDITRPQVDDNDDDDWETDADFVVSIICHSYGNFGITNYGSFSRLRCVSLSTILLTCNLQYKYRIGHSPLRRCLRVGHVILLAALRSFRSLLYCLKYC